MSKKAERIYEDTAKVIANYVRKGVRFDNTTLVHGEHELIYMRTISDLMSIWERKANSLAIKARRYERHPEEAERWPSIYDKFVRDIETTRRMYLSIKRAEKNYAF